MAGDWIKVEHATVDKPEVIRLADLMGFHPDQAVGLLVRFWVWLDRNLRDDSVTLLYAKTIDAVTHENGFCGALCAIGWAEIDDKTGIVTIKNVERHNGNPAKTRALTRDRNVTLRSRDRDAHTVTREDKIRLDIKTSTRAPRSPSSSRRKAQTTVPEDFAVSGGVLKWAATNGHSRLQAHLENFKLTCAAKGYTYANHDAAFKKAIRSDWAKLGAVGKSPLMTVLPDLPRRDGDIPDAARAVIAKMRAHG